MGKSNVSNNQEMMLNVLRKEKIPTTIFLMNGFIYTNAIIQSFDNYSVTFMAKAKAKSKDDPRDTEKTEKMGQHMVYKHALSTLSPSKEVDLTSIREKA